MKKVVIGVVAHVDSGKTTLGEAMLYDAGGLRKLGRVDNGDSFLDTDTIERERGITVFSKQARFSHKDTEFLLIDTPGHVDFTAETERTLRVLDYALLVISASDGIQGHTEVLWKLLEHYDIPTFIFVNKTDLPFEGADAVMRELREKLSDGCIRFDEKNEAFYEEVAMQSEELLSEYEHGTSFSSKSIAQAIGARAIFPCYFGSALKNYGVSVLIDALDTYTEEKKYTSELSARVYKVGEDERGARLTYLKVTGGVLKVRSVISYGMTSEKVSEIRLYSGSRYTTANEVEAGDICAVCGITALLPGDGIGNEISERALQSEPIFSYSVRLPEACDVNNALSCFRRLAQEETQLRVSFNEHIQRINVELMGEVQLEVLKRVMHDRFELDVEFENGSIIYKETIAESVEGIGHYEPLRHYAEVHLLLTPGERGSGLTFTSECSENELDRNWQRLVLTHLAEKEHRGVLCGAPITDMKISLVSGRAHKKHTEGGDFRQATYRAVRQGMMKLKSKGRCILLEPWCKFSLSLPQENVGRAMTDLSVMMAEYELSEQNGETAVIVGRCALSRLRDYGKQVISFTHGKGRLMQSFDSYSPCTDADEVIARMGYDPEGDLMNTPDSVFCSSGAGFLVQWQDVESYMHLPLLENKRDPELLEPTAPKKRDHAAMIAEEEEILRIFEATYGKIKRREADGEKKKKNSVVITPKAVNKAKAASLSGPTYLLVDGYNVIFASDELKAMASESLDLARSLLIDLLSTYKAMRECEVILVFDAYKVKGGAREVEQIHGISVIYTKEAETADKYIEKAAFDLAKDHRVKVATSDAQIQMIIFGAGAVRVTANELIGEIRAAQSEMRRFIEENNRN